MNDCSRALTYSKLINNKEIARLHIYSVKSELINQLQLE